MLTIKADYCHVKLLKILLYSENFEPLIKLVKCSALNYSFRNDTCCQQKKMGWLKMFFSCFFIITQYMVIIIRRLRACLHTPEYTMKCQMWIYTLTQSCHRNWSPSTTIPDDTQLYLSIVRMAITHLNSMTLKTASFPYSPSFHIMGCP